MKMITCTKCFGEGYIPDTDIMADEGDSIVCDQCEASGLIELNPF